MMKNATPRRSRITNDSVLPLTVARLVLLLLLSYIFAPHNPINNNNINFFVFVLGFRSTLPQFHQKRAAEVAVVSFTSSFSWVLQQQRHPSPTTNNKNNKDDDDDDDDNNKSSSSSPIKSSFTRNSSSESRRLALERLGGIALSSLLLSSTNVVESMPALAADDTQHKKRILITGSNSGIGLDAAQRMVLRGHEVVLACRTIDKAMAAADRIKTNIANDSEDAVDANSLLKSLKLVPMECNLADLSSIDAFVNNLTNNSNSHTSSKNRNGNVFDAVCYNAGVARNVDARDVARTIDGFELTVGTNHLGHFYLNHLLLGSNLIRNESGDNSGRIVVTSSSVHDPESPGGAQGATASLGDLKGLERAISQKSRQFDMVDGEIFNADKAYKDSKLCNILFVRELQRRLDQNVYSLGESSNYIKVNCFTPGLIVGTGLFRDQNKVFTKLFDIAATNLLKVGETTHFGGGALEYMTLSKEVGEKSGGLYYFSLPGSSKYGDDAYGNQFDATNVSKEARESDNNGKAKRLWELSEKLVGISPM